MKKKYFNIISLFIVLLASNLLSKNGVAVIKEILGEKDNRVIIVIDAGHGGFDPGKIGINKALEKDINLSISKKLKGYLEQKGIKVIMTREEDKGLHDENTGDKKRADMRKRVSIINESDALIAVSIHQNSFTAESSKGFQAFYYQNSVEGKLLAETLQEKAKDTLKDGNRREAKSNQSYYMLKNTRCPLVIVECGFLSNWTEAKLLCDEEYQKKVAWAIHLGILEYLNLKAADLNTLN
ncbi:N-acetylmuramoyl-L-alanine amidase CwlD [Anaerocolumna cellulosilytica]|uniref:N-acetylmuramoyl-L-alanine amidase CwlD n=1 Tax=Anaerocolumna cellulosilytica TaxID=433286 RepID=A0A6S6R4L4_9FIRM|nr:N-acetylmuramoyl-L-alanine amidase [Anaerocolumna cellulosilytica]MBB5197223.1 N-acetylmuramoyl-L-alanine amidase [Anaerocolumna cellulosilytica]BCJ94031.1 N-acetylmuramoyl-L-alanine amidase CwlD [Anaerocolumna cellulosilytica]